MTIKSEIIFDLLCLSDSAKSWLAGFDSSREKEIFSINGDIILADERGENLVGNTQIDFFSRSFQRALTEIANGKNHVRFDILYSDFPMEVCVENNLIAITRLTPDLKPWRRIESLSFNELNKIYEEFRNKGRRLISEYVDLQKLESHYGNEVF